MERKPSHRTASLWALSTTRAICSSASLSSRACGKVYKTWSIWDPTSLLASRLIRPFMSPFPERIWPPLHWGSPCVPSQQPPWRLSSTKQQHGWSVNASARSERHISTHPHIAQLLLHLGFYLLKLPHLLHTSLDLVKVTGPLPEEFVQLVDLKRVIFNLWRAWDN